MENSDMLNVKVSGDTVYKAVANYLKNSPEFKDNIQEKVKLYLESNALEESFRQHVKNAIENNWDLHKEIKKIIEIEVKNQISQIFSGGKLIESVRKAIKDLL
jgi:DNA polymerase II small subunit/DNA polymerase delta subunit B